MDKKIISLLIALALSCGASTAYAQKKDGSLIPLNGISVNMKKKKLLNNWGFPSKRDHKIGADVWFYQNEHTANPTDGIVVYFNRGKVERWKAVDNIYSEMEVWGKGAGKHR
jgi:hypothetical protein